MDEPLVIYDLNKKENLKYDYVSFGIYRYLSKLVFSNYISDCQWHGEQKHIIDQIGIIAGKVREGFIYAPYLPVFITPVISTES